MGVQCAASRLNVSLLQWNTSEKLTVQHQREAHYELWMNLTQERWDSVRIALFTELEGPWVVFASSFEFHNYVIIYLISIL